MLNPSQVLPTSPDDLSGPRVPQRFLQRRFISRSVEAIQQVLVQWSNWPPELATWEDLDYMKQIFPYAPAWGQEAFQGVGNVTETTQEPADKPRRSERAGKPNSKSICGEWSGPSDLARSRRMVACAFFFLANSLRAVMGMY